LIFESAQADDKNVKTAIPQRPPSIEDFDASASGRSAERHAPVAGEASASADTGRVLETLLGNL
jgi:hypothetical protein